MATANADEAFQMRWSSHSLPVVVLSSLWCVSSKEGTRVDFFFSRCKSPLHSPILGGQHLPFSFEPSKYIECHQLEDFVLERTTKHCTCPQVYVVLARGRELCGFEQPVRGNFPRAVLRTGSLAEQCLLRPYPNRNAHHCLRDSPSIQALACRVALPENGTKSCSPQSAPALHKRGCCCGQANPSHRRPDLAADDPHSTFLTRRILHIGLSQLLTVGRRHLVLACHDQVKRRSSFSRVSGQ
mmetsp:Transcript_24185/g.50273  ORF Transcript_24185/g.50273 Transcript_24185/m.50273 type:complete len:241 (-) Transcript_24185:1205-1927(-)